MQKAIKWVAIIILFPVLVIKQLVDVFKEAGIEMPDPDEALAKVREELQGEAE